MCNRWLSDLASHSLHHLVIPSEQAHKDLPHSTLDNIKQPITMVEAMDDTLLISVSISLLLFLARHADRFQGTYDWETEWAKSVFYAFQAPEFPPTTEQRTFPVPSVNYANPSSPQTFENRLYHFSTGPD
jgi:hypothetical protein